MKDSNTIIGYDAQAYARRDSCSPDTVRDVVWNLVCDDIKGNILDAGCGKCYWIKKIKTVESVKKIIGVDIVDRREDDIKFEFYKMDVSLERLPCEDNALDWIFAIELLEHLANPRHFVKEAARCLKQGGKFIITTPSNENLRARLSFLFRGYFPYFDSYNYSVSGHISPIFEFNLKQMAEENVFRSIKFFYNCPGRIPKCSIFWQDILFFLKGRLWTDALIAIITK